MAKKLTYLEWLHRVTVLGYAREIMIDVSYQDGLKYIYDTGATPQKALDQYETTAKRLQSDKHSCSNCKFLHYGAPERDDPYPKYVCKKGVFSCIADKEELEELLEANNCVSFSNK